MKQILALALALMFAGAAAGGELYAQIDNDGDLGTLVDQVEVLPNDLVTFDVWILGDEGGGGMLSFGVVLCEYAGSLEFFSLTYDVGDWTIIPPLWLCPTLQATDFSGESPIFFPARVGTVTWRAVQEGVTADIYLEVSGILGYDFSEHLFDNIGDLVGRVVIGSTGTRSSGWGAVKGLFR